MGPGAETRRSGDDSRWRRQVVSNEEEGGGSVELSREPAMVVDGCSLFFAVNNILTCTDWDRRDVVPVFRRRYLLYLGK